jgi:hypothetical protein
MRHMLSGLCFVAPVLAAALLAGCGLGKVQECNKLIQAANTQSQAIQASSTKVGSGNPSDIDALATTFDSAATQVGQVDLKDDKLKKFQGDYKDMMTRAAKSCRDMSAAIRSKSIPQINKAKGELDSVSGNESKVVTEINGYCTGG